MTNYRSTVAAVWPRFVVPVLFFACIPLFKLLDSRLQHPHSPVGMHRVNVDGTHEVVLDDNVAGMSPNDSPGLFAGTTAHEMFHALTKMGFYDFDVPYAAALGYYTEWNMDHKLREKNKDAAFRRGLNSKDPSSRASSIGAGYVTPVAESEDTYLDAAELAGTVFSMFHGDLRGDRYFAASAMGIEHDFALALANNETAFDLIAAVRQGKYMVPDRARLNSDIQHLAEPTRSQAAKYAEFLLATRRVFLTTQGDTVPFSFGLPPEAYLERGWKHLDANEFGPAIDELTQALKSRPGYVDALYARGMAYGSSGNLMAALADLDAAAKARPNAAKYQIARGIALGKMGHFDDGVKAFNAALELEPDNSEARENLGVTLFNLGEYEKALLEVERVLASKPESKNALFAKGLALEKLGHPSDAMRTLESFVRVGDGDQSFKIQVAMAKAEIAKLHQATK